MIELSHADFMSIVKNGRNVIPNCKDNSRIVITPTQTDIHLDIPKKYIGKKVEVTFSEVDESKENKKHQATLGDFYGVLSKEEGESLRKHTERVRNEWDRLI
jgi:hypothetical protein